jgi:hypothetical protein
MALDLRLCRVRTGVAAMGQDCNHQLDNMKKGVKSTKKQTKDFAFLICFTQ